MKRKKRFPKLMFILLVMLAIVLVWLLVMSREKVSPVNTKWFPAASGAVSAPAPEVTAETPADAVVPQEPATEAQVPVTPDTASEAETPAAETQPATEAAPAVSGVVVDTGVIRTMCPDGWMYFEQRDVFGEKDENGEYPVDPTQMCFTKGAETELDVFSKLSMYVYYQNTGFSQTVIDNNVIWYSETEPFTMTINGVECQGFHAKDEDIFNEGQYYEYDNIFLPLDDSHHIQIRIMTAAPGNADTVSRDDADVQLILTNLAVD